MVTIVLWTAFQDSASPASSFADALASVLRQEFSDASLEVVDVVGRWGKRVPRALLREGVSALRGWFPGVWGDLYFEKYRDSLAQLRHLFSLDQIRQEFCQQSVDLVIVCHPVALWLASQLRWSTLEQNPAESFPVLCWIPTFHFHASHAQPGISRYAIMHPGLLPSWSGLGISSEKLWSSGIPCLHERVTREEARAQLQVDETFESVALLRADMMEESELALWFQQCQLFSRAPLWWIDYGDSDELADFLREEAMRWGVAARMFGHQHRRRPLFYAAADVVMLRARPWDVMQVLSCQTPVALWQPRPGPELEDANFLSAEGLGVVVSDWVTLDDTLQAAAQLNLSGELVQSSWREEVREMLAHREAILRRDARSLMDELELLEVEPAPEEEPAPEKEPASLSPDFFFEDIGRAPVSSKRKKESSSVPEESLNRQLAQLKKRMKIDRANLDLSKLEDE